MRASVSIAEFTLRKHGFYNSQGVSQLIMQIFELIVLHQVLFFVEIMSSNRDFQLVALKMSIKNQRKSIITLGFVNSKVYFPFILHFTLIIPSFLLK